MTTLEKLIDALPSNQDFFVHIACNDIAFRNKVNGRWDWTVHHNYTAQDGAERILLSCQSCPKWNECELDECIMDIPF